MEQEKEQEEDQAKTKNIHRSINVFPQGSLTMFTLHLILSFTSRQMASHTIQQRIMVRYHTVTLKE